MNDIYSAEDDNAIEALEAEWEAVRDEMLEKLSITEM